MWYTVRMEVKQDCVISYPTSVVALLECPSHNQHCSHLFIFVLVLHCSSSNIQMGLKFGQVWLQVWSENVRWGENDKTNIQKCPKRQPFKEHMVWRFRMMKRKTDCLMHVWKLKLAEWYEHKDQLKRHVEQARMSSQAAGRNPSVFEH